MDDLISFMRVEPSWLNHFLQAAPLNMIVLESKFQCKFGDRIIQTMVDPVVPLRSSFQWSVAPWHHTSQWISLEEPSCHFPFLISAPFGLLLVGCFHPFWEECQQVACCYFTGQSLVSLSLNNDVKKKYALFPCGLCFLTFSVICMGSFSSLILKMLETSGIR